MNKKKLKNPSILLEEIKKNNHIWLKYLLPGKVQEPLVIILTVTANRPNTAQGNVKALA